MKETELAGVLCARLCHDLGSPVGAMVNGLDLLRELGPEAGSDELDMLDRTARRATALLRFHRLAFGIVRDPESTVPRGELRARAEAVLAGPRVEVGWCGGEGPPIGAKVARLAALMLLAGRAMLGTGGTLRVVLPSRGDLPLAVMSEGASPGASDDQRRWLEGAEGPVPDAPEVEFALIPAAAADVGARIELIEGDGQLALRAVAA